jgi:hypothetical protein
MVMGSGRPTQTFRNLRNQTQKNKKRTKKTLSKLPSQTLCVNAQGLCWPVQAAKKIKNRKNRKKKLTKLPS